MIGRLLKKALKWAAKTLKREGKKKLIDKIVDVKFEDVGIPRRRK